MASSKEVRLFTKALQKCVVLGRHWGQWVLGTHCLCVKYCNQWIHCGQGRTQKALVLSCLQDHCISWNWMKLTCKRKRKKEKKNQRKLRSVLCSLAGWSREISLPAELLWGQKPCCYVSHCYTALGPLSQKILSQSVFRMATVSISCSLACLHWLWRLF